MKRTQYFLMITICAFLLASCATTHKTATETSNRSYDTTAIVKTDTAKVHAERKDSVALVMADSTATSSRATETADNEETIVERIVETTDTMGRKVATTDRTINRKGTTRKETADTSNRWHQLEQTAVMLSALDSIADSYFANYNTHWAQNDSTHQEKEKEYSGTLSVWDSICNNMGKIILAVCIVGFAWFVWKTKD